MARRELPLTHFTAERVLVPAEKGSAEVIRVTVFGPNFPQRAVAPEMLIGDVAAERVSIAPDQKSIRGLFRRVPPEGALIRVRYGDSQEGILREPFVSQSVRPLPKECR